MLTCRVQQFRSFNPKHSLSLAKCLVKQIELLRWTKITKHTETERRWRVEKACFPEFTLVNLSAHKLFACVQTWDAAWPIISFHDWSHSNHTYWKLLPLGQLNLFAWEVERCREFASPGSCRAGRCGTPPHSWAWGCGTLWWALWHVSSEERRSSGSGSRPIRWWDGRGKVSGMERLLLVTWQTAGWSSHWWFL